MFITAVCVLFFIKLRWPNNKINYNLYPPHKLADQYLEHSFTVKYLGLIIDCSLSWHDHIEYICSKISKSINIIAKLKPYVTRQSLISIYYALVYPYLTYGCVLWGNNYEASVSQLVRLHQNKVVRIINNRCHSVIILLPIMLACVASVTVAFFAKKTIFVVLDAREMGGEQKQGGGGRGEEAKVSFLPLSSLPPSLFSFSPHFARVQK